MHVSRQIVINTSLDLNLPWTPKTNCLISLQVDCLSECYPCEVYQMKSRLNVASYITNRQHYVKSWQILWNTQVHCRFVVTLSQWAVWVMTITWYKYLLHCWNLFNSFPQMKKEWSQTKMTCVIFLTHSYHNYMWLLR